MFVCVQKSGCDCDVLHCATVGGWATVLLLLHHHHHHHLSSFFFSFLLLHLIYLSLFFPHKKCNFLVSFTKINYYFNSNFCKARAVRNDIKMPSVGPNLGMCCVMCHVYAQCSQMDAKYCMKRFGFIHNNGWTTICFLY